ncbi:MAG: hypothetical protein E6J11_12235 [Chloroflexi bacterium]|nr:MAG: hypothetical protein E6J11_12235 [Chloroflexota bacterium]
MYPPSVKNVLKKFTWDLSSSTSSTDPLEAFMPVVVGNGGSGGWGGPTGPVLIEEGRCIFISSPH